MGGARRNDDTDLAGVDAREALRLHAEALSRQAQAAARAYSRSSWVKYTIAIAAVPMIVLYFRLRMEAWHYYVAGAAFVIVALAMALLDQIAAEKRDKLVAAAEEAWKALDPPGRNQGVARFGKADS